MRSRLFTVVAAAALTTLALPVAAAATGSPTVTKVAPNLGPTAGGTHVTVTGKNFDSVEAVRFGGVDAAFHRVSSTQLTATTPAHAVGRVTVAIVTASGRGVAKAAFDYAKPAAPPVGAGYLVPRAHAPSGSLTLTVPHLTCRPHESSDLGVTMQDVVQLDANDRWESSASFRCVDGVAVYRSFLHCEFSSGPGPKPHPGDRLYLEYDHEGNSLQVFHGNSGSGQICLRDTNRPSNEPSVAFLVRTASNPPAALQSLKVHVTVAGGKLSAAHPTRQSQPVPFRRQLHAGPIASDGKTFTVRLRTQ